MTPAPADQATTPRDSRAHSRAHPVDLTLDIPRPADGAAIWRLARDSRVLDLNSPYSYLLWCRDHAATSIVAREGSGEPVGFVTGYTRPEEPRTLMVWQVAVARQHQGRGLAAAMVDSLVRRTRQERGVTLVETTITPDNTASDQLFTSFAARHGATVTREVLFDTGAFPEGGHAPEVLYRIGPVDDAADASGR